MPHFAETIPNVTVTVGRDALLACVVENLRGYKVKLLSNNQSPQTFNFVFYKKKKKPN